MSKTSEYIDRLIAKVKSPDFKVFVFFLCISILVWLVEKLRQDYTTVVGLEIECTNIPENFRIAESDIAPIRVNIAADGFSILNLLSNSDNRIPIDISQLRKLQTEKGTEAVLITRYIRSAITEHLPDHVELRGIVSDTIYIPLLTLESRHLPVIVCGKTQLEPQFNFTRKPTISPDSVLVFGTNNIIDTMTAVYTLPHETLTLHDTLSLQLQLDIPKDVDASATEAVITYYVESYTEKSLEVPITAINVPHGYNFKAFPQTAHVKFNVGLSNFEKVGINDIDITADLIDITPGSSTSKIKLKLVEWPDFISNITYSPIFVEYLLERNRDVKE